MVHGRFYKIKRQKQTGQLRCAIGKGGKVVTVTGTLLVSRLLSRAVRERSNSVTCFGPTHRSWTRRTDHPHPVDVTDAFFYRRSCDELLALEPLTTSKTKAELFAIEGAVMV